VPKKGQTHSAQKARIPEGLQRSAWGRGRNAAEHPGLCSGIPPGCNKKGQTLSSGKKGQTLGKKGQTLSGTKSGTQEV